MKTYFIRLFNYDKYANELIADVINQEGWPEKPVQLMAHTLSAQRIWLNRCLGTAPPAVKLWPDFGTTSNNFLELITENHRKWVDYLNEVNEEDFERVILYENLKGTAYENRLSDIIGHVINHGTHHRAQIGQLLKYNGFNDLPVTDYIFYLR